MWGHLNYISKRKICAKLIKKISLLDLDFTALIHNLWEGNVFSCLCLIFRQSVSGESPDMTAHGHVQTGSLGDTLFQDRKRSFCCQI